MYVIFDRTDGHIIDRADSAGSAINRSWWRKNVKVATESWYKRYSGFAS